MIFRNKFNYWRSPLINILLGSNLTILLGDAAIAQIKPDNTLNSQSSVVRSNVTIRRLPADLIEGGVTRKTSLFHSFSEFNIREKQRVYFANPSSIENIFSRVTGSNPSNILGTLGVLGNANLFLLNPNGIIFGKNSQLDIRGSFVASTANSLIFPDGNKFSAVDRQAPPLLIIGVPIGLQYNERQPANIINTGNLKVGKDLTLSGGTVTSIGQLAAPAGQINIESRSGDVQVENLTAQTAVLYSSRNLILRESQLRTRGNLNLLARDTVAIADSKNNPFIAEAGGRLLVQGDRHVKIFALNHPNSGLFSFGDIILRSLNRIEGDALYWSGGNFRIEKLDNSLGNLISPDDPIILARGDVSFSNYEGSSLHILAGGSVKIGTIIITGTGTVGSDFIKETIRLSDGTLVSVDGRASATLDIRSGVELKEIERRNINGLTSTNFFSQEQASLINPPTNADITIGSIEIEPSFDFMPTILITNQYKPNRNLKPNPSITIGSINASLFENNPFLEGNGVSIFADSQGDIKVQNLIADGAEGFFIDGGVGGKIVLLSKAQINVLDNISSSSFSNSSTSAKSGDIRIEADTVVLAKEAKIATTTNGSVTAGNVIIKAARNITLNENSLIESEVKDGATGNGGNIEIETSEGSLLMKDGAILNSRTLGRGKAGDITLKVFGEVDLSNTVLTSNVSAGAEGNGGNINIEADSVSLTNGSQLRTLVNPSNTEQNRPAGRGNAGDIILKIDSLSLDKESQILASTSGRGNAGNIKIENANTVDLTNNSSISTSVNEGAIGQGGEININARSLSLNNSQITASTAGQGDAGSITVKNADSVSLDNSTISTAVNEGAIGQGGDINLNAQDLLFLRNNSQIAANAEENSNGNGGNITINAGTIFAFPQQNNDIIANAFRGNGGNIEITAQGIFYLEERKGVPDDRTNEINASSEFGVDGTVRIDTPNVDASRRLVRFPTLTTTPEVLQGCRAATQRTASRFINTGRGGLPPGIDEIGDRTVWEDLRSPTPIAENTSESETVESSKSPEPTQIIEAQGLLVASDGKIVLTAQAPTVTPTQIGDASVGCRISQ